MANPLKGIRSALLALAEPVEGGRVWHIITIWLMGLALGGLIAGPVGYGMGKEAGRRLIGWQPEVNDIRKLQGLVRRLATIEKVSGKELRPDQAEKVINVTAKLQSLQKVSYDESKRQLDAINAVLTTEQKDALSSLHALQPQLGGGGMPGRGIGGMMDGGKAPDNPFAEGQGKERVDELISLLKRKVK